MGHFFALIAFAVFALAFASPSHAAQPSWMPRQSCKEAWASLIRKNGHSYDYQSDVKNSPEGNLGYSRFAERVHRENCYKDFTVLVYMAADNDLAPYALLDLYEMEAGFASDSRLAGSTLKLDLVVQAETNGDRARRFQMFQTAEVYDPRIAQKINSAVHSLNEVRSPVIEFVDKSKNVEDKFRDFLKWGVHKFPAKNYAVIVWGHGQGWSSGLIEDVQPRILDASDVKSPLGRSGVISADVGASNGHGSQVGTESPAAVFGGIALGANQDRLSIPNLNRDLADVVRDDLAGNPFALYISDACLMQMLEVANEISDSARFIVGSTQVENFLGLPYRRILSEINDGKFAGVADENDLALRIAKMIPKVFRSSMTPGGLQGRGNPKAIKSITLSAISSSELRFALVPALKDFSKAAIAYLDEEPLRAVDVEYLMAAVPGFEGGAQELGSFFTLFANAVNKELRQKPDALTDSCATPAPCGDSCRSVGTP